MLGTVVLVFKVLTNFVDVAKKRNLYHVIKNFCVRVDASRLDNVVVISVAGR